MRKVSVFSIVIFILSVVSFTGYLFFYKKDTDRIGPQITMESNSIEAEIGVSDEELLEGVTANDKKDGDVTDSLVIENISKFWDTGKCTVNYAAFDSDGNVGIASRTLTYTNYKSPEFDILKPIIITPTYAGDFTEFIKVNDCIDGDITNLVKISPESNIKTYEDGDNYLKYVVTNRYGETIELPVNVIINKGITGDSLSLVLSKYIVYTSVGESVDPLSYIAHVKVGGKDYTRESISGGGISVNDYISTEGDIDFNTPGTYQVNITLKDSNNNGENINEDTVEKINNSVTVPLIIVVR